MKYFAIIILFCCSITNVTMAGQQIFDENGHLIMQENDDGTISLYSYDKNGKQSKIQSKDEAIVIDSNGTSIPVPQPSSDTQ